MQMIGECEACGFENIKLEKYSQIVPEERIYFLCDVCADTRIGSAHQFPRQYESVALLRTVGYTTNLLLLKIAELENKIDKLLIERE